MEPTCLLKFMTATSFLIGDFGQGGARSINYGKNIFHKKKNTLKSDFTVTHARSLDDTDNNAAAQCKKWEIYSLEKYFVKNA